MAWPYDADDIAAIDRLGSLYNGGPYDAGSNPGGFDDDGHQVNFIPSLQDVALVVQAVGAAATAAGTSATNAGDSAAAAALSAAKLIGSSASSVAIAVGSRAFVTQAGKFFAPGAFVLIYSAANPTANYMAGQVSAYSGTDLTVDVTVAKGSGTFTDWVIVVSGAPGSQGLIGLTGPTGPTPDIMVTFSDGVTDADPGNGLLKFNNAAPASTTQLYVDNLDRYGTSIASWLDSFDDSTNTALRGTVKLVQVSDPAKYARFNVVGAVVDGTGYRKIPVAHVLSNGTFTAGAILAIDFVRTGNRGLDGDGAGDVLGPAVSVDGHVALFDGTSGKLLKSGGALAAVATSGAASDLVNTPAGTLLATNVQAALNELDGARPALMPAGRLTLTSGVAVTTTDVTGATSVYYTQAVGNRIPIWDGSGMTSRAFSELTLALSSNSGHTNYHESGALFDYFVFDDAGTLRLGTGPKWTTVAAGASVRGAGAGTSEIELFNGVWVNKHSITLRFGSASGNIVTVPARRATFVGVGYMVANGQTTDSRNYRYLANAFNRVPRILFFNSPTSSYVYSTAAVRIAEGSTANMIPFVVAIPGDPVECEVVARVTNSSGTERTVFSGIGLNNLTTFADITLSRADTCTTTKIAHPLAKLQKYPAAGFNYLAWLEMGAGADTQTWYPLAGVTGMSGTVLA